MLKTQCIPAWSLGLLAAVLLAGCNLASPPAATTATISSFQASVVEDGDAVAVCYKYKGTDKLKDVKVRTTITYQDGSQSTEEKFYGTWSPGETKRIPIHLTASIEKQ